MISKEVVIARLMQLPPNYTFVIAGKVITRNQAIDEVRKESEIGKQIIKIVEKMLSK